MHLFATIKQVCNAEYREALKSSSPADPCKVVPSLPAPARPGQRVSTISNETQWAAIGAFLADRVVNP
jgi:hypothetical protein